MRTLTVYEEKVKERVSEYKSLCKTLGMAQQELKLSVSHSKACEEASVIAQEVARTIQDRVHSKIATLVSRCLREVFDEPYEFVIHFESKRGKTEARLVFQRDGMEVDPMSSGGGGVLDVAAFALRVIALVMTRPPLRRLLVLDERVSSRLMQQQPTYRPNNGRLTHITRANYRCHFWIKDNSRSIVTLKLFDLEFTYHKPEHSNPALYFKARAYASRACAISDIALACSLIASAIR